MEVKFIKHQLKPELLATGKQRRFYRILTGQTARRGITRGGLNELIQLQPVKKIAEARAKYKSERNASKFTRFILSQLNGEMLAVKYPRGFAEVEIARFPKESRREAVRAWRARSQEV
jgi:hypothetical protein